MSQSKISNANNESLHNNYEVSINNEDFLKSIANQVVLKVLSASINILNSNNNNIDNKAKPSTDKTNENECEEKVKPTI
jgi:hypothetical protein